MRVFLLVHRFPPDVVTGIERVAEGLADGLAAAGDSVTVTTRRPGADLLEREARPNDVRVNWIGGRHPSFERPLHLDPAEARTTEGTFHEADPEVVHVLHLHGFDPRILHTAYRLRVPIVVSLQDHFFACPLAHLRKRDGRLCGGPDGGSECAATCFEREGESALQRWTARAAYFRGLLDLATVTVAPSRYIADYFAALGVPRERIRIIPNGVGTVTRPAGGRADSGVHRALKLAYIGSLIRDKGVDLILDAIELSRVPDVSLTIAGFSPDQRYVDQMKGRAATIPGLRLTVVGPYEDGELPGILGDADAVVVPSRVPESFSLTTREAFVQGVPAIVARLGALVDAVEEGVNGWTFEPGSAADLGSVLSRLWQEPGALESGKAGAARTTVTTVAEHVQMISSIYRETARGPAHFSAAQADPLDALRDGLGALTP